MPIKSKDNLYLRTTTECVNPGENKIITRVTVTPYINHSGHRNAKSESSTLEKINHNLNASVMRLRDVLNCNYTTDDYFVLLTLNDPTVLEIERKVKTTFGVNYPTDINFLKLIRTNRDKLSFEYRMVYDAAYHEIQSMVTSFFRRLKYSIPDLGYVYVIANMSTKRTGMGVRPHVHAVLHSNLVTLSQIKSKWTYGYVYRRKLKSGDKIKLARYMVKQVNGPFGTRKYRKSENLLHPSVDKEIIEDFVSEDYFKMLQECKARISTSKDYETGELYGWRATWETSIKE